MAKQYTETETEVISLQTTQVNEEEFADKSNGTESHFQLPDLAPVVRTLHSDIHRINTIQRINMGETNCAIHWIEIYPPFE